MSFYIHFFFFAYLLGCILERDWQASKSRPQEGAQETDRGLQLLGHGGVWAHLHHSLAGFDEGDFGGEKKKSDFGLIVLQGLLLFGFFFFKILCFAFV